MRFSTFFTYICSIFHLLDNGRIINAYDEINLSSGSQTPFLNSNEYTISFTQNLNVKTMIIVSPIKKPEIVSADTDIQPIGKYYNVSLADGTVDFPINTYSTIQFSYSDTGCLSKYFRILSSLIRFEFL